MFYLKKDSESSVIKYPITQQIKDRYDITDDMLESVAITFSMVDSNTGRFRIANESGYIVVNSDLEPTLSKYELGFKFNKKHTFKTGRYLGEFVLDFLNPEYGCGSIKLPNVGYLDIIITDSLTKTTVI